MGKAECCEGNCGRYNVFKVRSSEVRKMRKKTKEKKEEFLLRQTGARFCPTVHKEL